MRKLAIAAGILFALQLGYHQLLYRSATRDVIISTFRQPAIDACARNARQQEITRDRQAWLQPASMKLVIGKDDLDVYFWQVNSAMWNARYKNPYLFIVAERSPGNALCEYDIVHRSASVRRL